MSTEVPVHTKSSTPGGRGSRVIDVVPALFDATLFADEMATQVALRTLGRHIVDPTTVVEDAVVELEAPAHVLELVLSTVDDMAYTVLVKTILAWFKQGLADLLASPAPRLLSRFSLFFLFLSRTASEGASDSSNGACWRNTQAATAVLRELLKLRFVREAHIHREQTSVAQLDLPFSIKAADSSQSKRKQARRENRGPDVDAKILATYGARVPEAPSEALSLMGTICDAQCCALKEYLEKFRLPTVQAAVKDIFLQPFTSVSHVSQEQDDSSSGEDQDVARPPAYPFVQPMKAAQLFEDADGFGEWRVFFTPRAIRDLRHAKDGKLFSIVVKKMKELSNGHFSDDNHKRLTHGYEVESPVYEAKMTGNTRLVYQIDCVQEPGDEIHGVYTHNKIDPHRFWDAMRGQLVQQKGAEYQRRCAFRNPPVNPGDNVFLPATWRRHGI
ncbi:hypothetical protein BD309DRAFT_991683 [Dichomitus squalens]|uniref:Uncharacterized protein n=1 Tax=Dichomitus squalens TaxID=114155 RepID=A0A4Q9NRD0_9APHY|nr:hypothetical protein BD311DRAFT_781930 [Dichomitus squalens]TBU42431.1 hypothetical protein BD309DRAFT_991683 [Dichomitus squalens]TBU53437.1 hypothetical protein BD310DRAFT_952089 [Dichomitus squalens]